MNIISRSFFIFMKRKMMGKGLKMKPESYRKAGFGTFHYRGNY
jgi:hypothetical protein